MTPLLLTPEQAAEALACSRSKIYTLLQRGELASLKAGGSRRIRPRDLERYIDRLAAEQIDEQAEE